MRKYICSAIGSGLIGLALSKADKILEEWGWRETMISPDTAFYGLGAILLAVGIASGAQERRLASVRYFDIPILKAVSHLMQTEPHYLREVRSSRTPHVSLAPRRNVLWGIASYWKKGRDWHAKAHQRYSMQTAKELGNNKLLKSSWGNRVVPVAVKLVFSDSNCREFFGGHLDPGFVRTRVELGSDT